MTEPTQEPPPASRTAMPLRPSTASEILSPLHTMPTPAPASVVVSMWSWIVSCVVPLLAIVYSLTRLDDVRAHLQATALSETPDKTAESIDQAVTITLLIAIASLALPVVLQIILAIVMVNRRNWARILLLLVGVLGLPAAAIAFGALSDDGAANSNNLTIGISVQGLFVLIGIITMFLPSANYWFRTRRR